MTDDDKSNEKREFMNFGNRQCALIPKTTNLRVGRSNRSGRAIYHKIHPHWLKACREPPGPRQAMAFCRWRGGVSSSSVSFGRRPFQIKTGENDRHVSLT